MSRVLLVNVGPMAAAALQMLIRDEMPDLEAYSVDSAEKAAEMLDRNVYDVVVTDASVPGMSGMELLEHIKKQSPACYVIVLTAYNSFAARASRYGDVRFILRSGPPEAVTDAVRTGLDRVRRCCSAGGDGWVRQLMEDTLPFLKQLLFERLVVFGEPLPDRQICGSCGIGILPGRATRLAATGDVTSREKGGEVCLRVLSVLRDRGLRADAWYAGPGWVFFIQSGGEEDVPGMIAGQLDRIIEDTAPAEGLSFALTCAPVSWARIGEEALALAGYARRGSESGRIVIKPLSGEGERPLLLRDAVRWRRYVEKRDLPGLMAAVAERVPREGFPAGREEAALLMEMLLRESFGEGCLEGLRADGCPTETVLRHGHYETRSAWLADVGKLLESLFSNGGVRSMTETDDIVGRVNRYIREHYPEQISLRGIAEKFNYNSSYLSRIYKQNMREGLNGHIVRTRIETACRLLRDASLSVGEIAEQCGFRTAKYFIAVFKRMTGTTPKHWREMKKG